MSTKSIILVISTFVFPVVGAAAIVPLAIPADAPQAQPASVRWAAPAAFGPRAA